MKLVYQSYLFTALEEYSAPKAMAKFLGCGYVITSKELPDYNGEILHNHDEPDLSSESAFR